MIGINDTRARILFGVEHEVNNEALTEIGRSHVVNFRSPEISYW